MTTTTSAGQTLEPRGSLLSPAVLFAAMFAISLALTLGLRVPSFVHHDTTEIVMWGHSGWAWGFWKHPPFLPWLTRIWFALAPMSATSLAVLTALNMAVGALTVWAIARMSAARVPAAKDGVALLALILLAAVPYATVMAIKLNHNTVLVSLWPLTILSFLRALDRPTMLRGVLLGAIAVCAVLAKYYSALLLGSCVVAALVTTERARFWRASAPYAAAITFLFLVTPHALWLLEQGASTLGYAFQADTVDAAALQRGPLMALSFAAQTPLLMLPMALFAWVISRAMGKSAKAVLTGTASHRFERELVVVTVLPYLLTIGLTLAYNLRGATNWAMPLYLMLPVLLAARIGQPPAPLLRLAASAVATATIVLCIAGQIDARVAVARGVEGSVDPRREIAEKVTEIWRAAVGSPLTIVAGDNRLVSAVVLFSPDHPQGWPNFSTFQAPWIDRWGATESGFIAICRKGDPACQATASAAARDRGSSCELRHRMMLWGAVGPWVETHVLVVPPAIPGPSQAVGKPLCMPE